MSMVLALGSDVGRLLEGYSVEITAKEAKDLEAAKALLAPGTQIAVTFLANEDFSARVEAAKTVKSRGFHPVPHIAARRLHSEQELTQILERLQSDVGVDRVFVIAGDPEVPLGPYVDSLAVIRSGLLARYGIKKVGIAGHPDGHPTIPEQQLRRALADKLSLLRELGHEVEIVTQFGFDPDPVLFWLEQLRSAGVTAPVRIGVPGPTSITSLLRMAARIGVSTSGSVVAKYGISLTKLLGVTGPDKFLHDFAGRLQSDGHGEVRLHFYSFGSLHRAAAWIHGFQCEGET